MQFCYHRNYWHEPIKGDGTYRILCLGDSIVYGSGVLVDETLPAHLEQILNRACWGSLVEVLNEGISGYSLHDAWNRFLLRGRDYSPDLVILILSDNDAELFSVGSAWEKGADVTYEQHVVNTWKSEGVHLPHFLGTLDAIAEFSRTHSIPFLIAFHVIYNPPVRSKIVQILQKACLENDLDFVDLSEDFLEKVNEPPRPDYKVSDEDGHPSGLSHQIAAQRLARHLVSKGYCTTDGSAVPAEKAVYERVLAYADEAVAAASAPQQLFYRCESMLSAKRTSKARLKLGPDKRIDDEQYGAFRTALNTCYSMSIHALFLEGYVWNLEQNGYEFFKLADSIENKLVSVGKFLDLLENRKKDPSLLIISLDIPGAALSKKPILRNCPAALNSNSACSWGPLLRFENGRTLRTGN